MIYLATHSSTKCLISQIYKIDRHINRDTYKTTSFTREFATAEERFLKINYKNSQKVLLLFPAITRIPRSLNWRVRDFINHPKVHHPTVICAARLKDREILVSEQSNGQYTMRESTDYSLYAPKTTCGSPTAKVIVPEIPNSIIRYEREVRRFVVFQFTDVDI